MTARMAATATAALLVPALAAAPAFAAPAGVPEGAVAAKVVKIVDGDTIDVLRAGKRYRVRLLEVDTPERGQCWSGAAGARTAALLPRGRTAYLLADREPRDRYGRWLYYVWNAKGVHVNRNLVRYGYARAVLYKPNDRYIALMRAEQAKARKQRLRIWSGACDGGGRPQPTPTPTPSRSRTPAGNGNGNGNGNGGGGGGGTDPRYRTCAEANAHGLGPYVRGQDPEYAWYQDRDGDGVVCER
ncbi:thermonuclease family protein [Nonomuraea sp. NPDC050783]|uniref:thermonuclease family protein n=1 Tax=Nonomuraea sp. NPDC050783 TaxID=3154634 RepID=UPI003465FEE9